MWLWTLYMERGKWASSFLWLQSPLLCSSLCTFPTAVHWHPLRATCSYFTEHNPESLSSLNLSFEQSQALFHWKISNLKPKLTKYRLVGQKVFRPTSHSKNSWKFKPPSQFLPYAPPCTHTKRSQLLWVLTQISANEDAYVSEIAVLLVPSLAASVLSSKYLSTFFVV